ncbi:MAG: alpha-glucosidase, partial [Lachnospiraceae bacterium]|nr:alpha-glucosidase [Lachnospiraceae bacterium]
MNNNTNTNTRWWQRSVVYQIYPRSFQDSNGDGIGDLAGITSRLEYLAKLGIDVIWLSPVYQSPNDDNGYDISDYRAIMTEFGTMEDFDVMLVKAHSLGIRIVMDLVVNHSSDEHPWFKEAKKSKDNPYRDFYIWKDAVDGKTPNNWQSCFGGSAWQWDETTEQYYLHLFSKKQPDLNWENPKVRDAVFDMMDWWLRKGIDGFRMDVISMISKDQAYPDGNPLPNGYTSVDPSINGPRVHEFLQEMNRRVLSRYDIMTVGECAGCTVEEARKYANLDGRELSMAFEFEHPAVDDHPVLGRYAIGKFDLIKLKEVMTRWETGLEGIAWNSLYWCNHDQVRIVSRWGNDSAQYRKVSAKMLATCLHMMKGTPYIYEGEEIGMTNMPYWDSIDDYDDIESKGFFHMNVEKGLMTEKEGLEMLHKKSRDHARTPMQWDDTENAGFSTGKPWLHVNPNYKEINVKEALADPDSVFYYYQKLIRLRKESDLIVYGAYALLEKDHPDLYVYTR